MLKYVCFCQLAIPHFPITFVFCSIKYWSQLGQGCTGRLFNLSNMSRSCLLNNPGNTRCSNPLFALESMWNWFQTNYIIILVLITDEMDFQITFCCLKVKKLTFWCKYENHLSVKQVLFFFLRPNKGEGLKICEELHQMHSRTFKCMCNTPLHLYVFIQSTWAHMHAHMCTYKLFFDMSF